MTIRFYVFENPTPDSLEAARARSTAHRARFWRPVAGERLPPGGGGPAFLTYELMRRCGVFANDDYGAMLIERPGEAPDHRCSVFPGFFRFPFMTADDLQIGATFTQPEARGRGLARRAVLETIAALGRPGRRFWYLTEAANVASCRVIEKAGFRLAGLGGKQPRLGLKALGYYAISEPAQGGGTCVSGQA